MNRIKEAINWIESLTIEERIANFKEAKEKYKNQVLQLKVQSIMNSDDSQEIKLIKVMRIYLIQMYLEKKKAENFWSMLRNNHKIHIQKKIYIEEEE